VGSPSVQTRLAVLLPAALGKKLNVTLQYAPAPREVGHVSAVIGKSPGLVPLNTTLVTAMGDAVVLVIPIVPEG
jgi:hypothetical protein